MLCMAAQQYDASLAVVQLLWSTSAQVVTRLGANLLIFAFQDAAGATKQPQEHKLGLL